MLGLKLNHVSKRGPRMHGLSLNDLHSNAVPSHNGMYLRVLSISSLHSNEIKNV